MAANEWRTTDNGGSPESVAQLQRVSDLVRDACAEVTHLLIAVNSRISAEERRGFEMALQELRHAIHYLELQCPVTRAGSSHL